MRLLLSLGFTLFFIGACGGTSDNPLFGGDGGGGGDGGNGMSDGSGGGDSSVGPCDAKCGINVPNGFTLMLPLQDRAKMCPNGFTPHDIVGEPMAAADACSCACNVSQMPDCSQGTIFRNNDMSNSPLCNVMATTLMAKPGCNYYGAGVQPQGTHYSASLQPTGGACSWDGTPDPKKLTTREARLCEVPASCQGAVCGAQNTCVSTMGDVDCPMTFPNKTLVGSAAHIECTACGACKLESACSGTLSLYTDANCQNTKTDYPVDGTCNTNNVANMTFFSFQYQGKVAKAACAGQAPTSMSSAKLDMPMTVCCTQK
jgi:hypothetical protein